MELVRDDVQGGLDGMKYIKCFGLFHLSK